MLEELLGIRKDEMYVYSKGMHFEHSSTHFKALHELADLSPSSEDISIEFKSGVVGTVMTVSDKVKVFLMSESMSKANQLKVRWYSKRNEIKQLTSSDKVATSSIEFGANLKKVVHEWSLYGRTANNSILIDEIHQNRHIIALIHCEADIDLSKDHVSHIRHQFNGGFKNFSTSIKQIQALQLGVFSIGILELNEQNDGVTFVSAGLPFLFKNDDTYYKLKPADHGKSKISKYEAMLNRGDEVYMINVPNGDGSSTQNTTLKTIQKSLMTRGNVVPFKNVSQHLEPVMASLPKDFLMLGIQI